MSIHSIVCLLKYDNGQHILEEQLVPFGLCEDITRQHVPWEVPMILAALLFYEF